MFRFGITSLNPSLKEQDKQGLPFLPVRVIHTILSNEDPEWEKFGGWDSIGLIKFVPYYSDINANLESVNVAKPLFSNIKHYPLNYEITWVIQLPDPSSANNPNFSSFYYINTVNLWNHPHHNAFPAIDYNTLPENLQLNYKEIETGLVRQEASKSDGFKLGETFKEKSNIKPLLPFEGDSIYEGRWGQSLRFGSTVKGKNAWSETGENGDPITIIRNGQAKTIRDSEKGWIPTLEDINGDGSSVYFTQNQQIPIEVASSNLKSFESILPKVDTFKISLPDSPPPPKNTSVSSSDSNLTSSVDNNIPTPVVTSSLKPTTNSSINKNQVFNEGDIVFHFPGEDTQEFIFDIENVDEEGNEVSITPVKYDSKILGNESTDTKNSKGEYAVYTNGVPEYLPISYFEQIRVVDKYLPFLKLIMESARKEGIAIKLNSSFRTFDEQIELRKKNLKDKSKINDNNFLIKATADNFQPLTGKPGFSAHQKGTAFDFNTSNSTVYKWLVSNASKFGFIRTVRSERWHWEYIPNNDPFTFVKKSDESWDNLV
jgi:hypothetical protein